MSKNFVKETVIKHQNRPEAERFWNFPIEAGLIEMTIPDKPRSKNQRYRLTGKGTRWRKKRDGCR